MSIEVSTICRVQTFVLFANTSKHPHPQNKVYLHKIVVVFFLLPRM